MNIHELILNSIKILFFSVLSEFRSSHSAEDVNAPKTLTVPKNSVLRVWSDHSMPVTGIATSGCGYNRKIATSSLDQTCKVNFFAFIRIV